MQLISPHLLIIDDKRWQYAKSTLLALSETYNTVARQIDGTFEFDPEGIPSDWKFLRSIIILGQPTPKPASTS